MRFVFALLCLIATPTMAADMIRASLWRDVSEARVRLLLEPSTKAGEPLRGALEIRLAPGFKTYWRNPGDSGAPPVFDFSGSTGVGQIETLFPFPERFDDGAGGQAIGYKRDVLLPFLVARSAGNAAITLKLNLDFAVCGTMCIPLKANLSLDAAMAPSAPDIRAAFEDAFRQVPKRVTNAEMAGMVLVQRLASNTHPLFLVSLSGRQWPDDVTGFIDANGHFALLNRSRRGEIVDLLFEAHSAPGSGGRFGAARLTFGTKTDAFDAMIDLDGAVIAP